MSPLNWKPEIRALPFDAVTLLEACHFSWSDKAWRRREWAIALRANPHVAYFIRNKAPSATEWVDGLLTEYRDEPVPDAESLRQIEGDLIMSMADWIIYVTDPDAYQRQPFVGWDERELTCLTDWNGKRVLDIGSGTGKQAFAVARLCARVYCAEPVFNLRRYLRDRAVREGVQNVHVTEGFIEQLPFEDAFFDVVMGGHVFGDLPDREYAESIRVLKPGGLLIYIPGSDHDYLVSHGFQWAEFEEPGDGIKRKYWLTKT